MNDPHVVSLHYEVVSSPDVTFNAPPLDHSTPEFDVHLAEGQVAFTLRGHHSSEERAGSGFLNGLDKWRFCLTAARMAAEQERR
jgi:hypothetical protein